MYNGAVGLGGAAADILRLIQHQNIRAVARKLPRAGTPGHARADNDYIMHMLYLVLFAEHVGATIGRPQRVCGAGSPPGRCEHRPLQRRGGFHIRPGVLPLPQVRPFRKRNFAFWQRAGHVRPLPGGTLLKDLSRKFSPHPPLRATFSLRAKSRLRRLRSDTRQRAQPLGERQKKF